MRPAAIAFDMDDTLLRDDRTISDYSIRIIRSIAQSGVRVIPASGRAKMSMMPYINMLQCADCFISSNGAEVWTPDLELLWHCVFNNRIAQEIIAFGRSHQTYMQTYANDRFHYSQKGHWADTYHKAATLEGDYTPDIEAYVELHPTGKILMMAEEDKIAWMLREAMQVFDGKAAVTCSKPCFLEFNPPEATKANALKKCGEWFGFQVSDVIAFGDSLNDLSMLKAVGHGVCVENAREEVKSQVPHRCLSNENDGVAHYLETMLTNS